ncbi:uncharacterized protein LOC119720630 [Patiria miniata]|uniref:Uncharacterized protein n=1 Tax=Patiria miniata TaxID=46514 RepID=A0A913Z3N0_PATMI|nr:uncharacterized protein LOC119720630 [Patiria miniata]
MTEEMVASDWASCNKRGERFMEIRRKARVTTADWTVERSWAEPNHYCWNLVWMSNESVKELPSSYRSCHEWRLAGYEGDGTYEVDPDGPGGLEVFEVECEMDTGYTVVHHDKDVEGFTVRVTGNGRDIIKYETPGAYRKILNYTTASLPQIAALANASDRCSQFVSLECMNTEIWNERGTQMTWWVSQDQEKMFNWGGAPSGFNGCGCYVNNTCENGERCNCDNDSQRGGSIWRLDRGLLTDKSKLPVREVRVGDVGHRGERANVRVGPLRCYGAESEHAREGLFRNCEELRLNGRQRDDYYRIDPDGDGPLAGFRVWCNFKSDKAFTVIDNDMHDVDILVSISNDRNYEAPGAYTKKLAYEAPSMEHMVALINTSEVCRQYIWYKCRLAAIWKGDIQVTWLLSRNKEKMPNWGGAPSGWKGCECSIDNDCAGGGRCNCDRDVENVVRYDEGYLTDAAQLPVTAIQIGDIGDETERARFNIDPLECKGLRSKVTGLSSTETRRTIEASCRWFINTAWTGSFIQPSVFLAPYTFSAIRTWVDGSTTTSLRQAHGDFDTVFRQEGLKEPYLHTK